MVEMKLVVRGITKYENTIYLVPGYLNGIISVDLSTGITHFIRMCEKEHGVGQNLYEDILVSNGLIWCSPCMDDHIAVYDPSEQKFRYISLLELKSKGRDLYHCGMMRDIGDYILILPQEYPGILKADKNRFDIKSVPWKEELYRNCKEDFVKNLFGLSKDYEIDGEDIYLLDHNYIITYNFKDDRIKTVRICEELKNFTGIAKFRDGWILFDRLHAEIFEWTQETNTLNKINVNLGYGGLDTENEEGDACPVGLVQIKDKVAILLAASSYLYLLDEKYQLEKIPLAMESIEEYGVKWHYMCYEFDGRNLYLPLCCENRILIVDTETWKQKIINIHLSESDAENIFTDAMTAEKPLAENRLFYSLEHFIDRLAKI